MRIHKHLPKLAALGAMLVLAACSAESGTTAPVAADELAAPALPSVAATSAIVAEQAERPTTSAHGTFALGLPSTAVTYQFVHNPTSSATYIVGTHMVHFPAYTICDPEVSGYGASTWLTSCPKLTSPIVITATTWIDLLGRAQIDFNNEIRFYKNYNNQLPAIYLRDPSAAITSWGRVDYCSASGCVNEAATDSALATKRDPITGYLFRLIRHFSGYNVWA